MVTDKQVFIDTIKRFHPEKSLQDVEKEYELYCKIEKEFDEQQKFRHLLEGTETILFKSWTDFDVKQVYAKSPHPLKSVELGFMYNGDIPCESKDIVVGSISTKITKESHEKGGISLEIISLEEAIKRVKGIDWLKVPIER